MFPSERFRNIRCPYGEELCPRKYHCFFSHRPDTSANARLPHIKVVNEAFPNEDGSPKTIKKRPRQAVLDPVASKRPAVDPDSNKPTITAATSHVPTTATIRNRTASTKSYLGSQSSALLAPKPCDSAVMNSTQSQVVTVNKSANTLAAVCPTSKTLSRYETASPHSKSLPDSSNAATSLVMQQHLGSRSPAKPEISPMPGAVSGIPKIQPSLHSKVKKDVRQKILTSFYNQFLRIYKPILNQLPSIAHDDAIKQESILHNSSKAMTYTMMAATVLRQLIKRPVSTGVLDIGISGEWVEPQAIDSLSKVNVDLLGPFIHTLEELETLGYPLGPFDQPDSKPVIEAKDESAISHEKHQTIDKTVATDNLVVDAEPLLKSNSACKLVKYDCDRCGNPFVLKYPLEEYDKTACMYHYGRWRMVFVDAKKERLISCCSTPVGTPGCTMGPHVFKEESNSQLNERIPFIELPSNTLNALPVVALDCEMSYTTGGMELTRVTVVDWNGNRVFDELCIPCNPILDLNTRWSGITSLDSAKYNLKDIQQQLGKLISTSTIIIGHGLENDLRALRIKHTQVIDTVKVFPHPNGLPYRQALRTLASKILGRFVQTGENGHDSMEDAMTCIDLLKTKLK
ncbi:hypothetical protein MT418_003705 [Batrachochytrium dendrobatidis]